MKKCVLLLLAFLVFSCSDDDDSNTPETTEPSFVIRWNGDEYREVTGQPVSTCISWRASKATFLAADDEYVIDKVRMNLGFVDNDVLMSIDFEMMGVSMLEEKIYDQEVVVDQYGSLINGNTRDIYELYTNFSYTGDGTFDIWESPRGGPHQGTVTITEIDNENRISGMFSVQLKEVSIYDNAEITTVTGEFSKIPNGCD